MHIKLDIKSGEPILPHLMYSSRNGKKNILFSIYLYTERAIFCECFVASGLGYNINLFFVNIFTHKQLKNYLPHTQENCHLFNGF